MRRTGETIMVRCNVTGETYFLTCRDSAWKGELYNCSQGTGDVRALRYANDTRSGFWRRFLERVLLALRSTLHGDGSVDLSINLLSNKGP